MVRELFDSLGFTRVAEDAAGGRDYRLELAGLDDPAAAASVFGIMLLPGWSSGGRKGKHREHRGHREHEDLYGASRRRRFDIMSWTSVTLVFAVSSVSSVSSVSNHKEGVGR